MHQRRWLLVFMIVAVLCFIGLYYIVTYLWPHPDTIIARPQLLLFTFMFVGLGTGTVPVAAYLNHRFSKPGWPERDRIRLAREGAWVGFFGVLVAYLQLIRALNWTIAAILAGVFVLIEAFFLTRE